MIGGDGFDFLFGRTSDGVLIVGEGGRIERVNPAAAALLLLPAGEMVGKTLAEVFGAESVLAKAADVETTSSDVPLPRNRSAFVQSRHIGSAGAGRRCMILITEIGRDGSAPEAFLSAVAHDLRNPLAAVIGYASLIGSEGNLNDDQQYFLERLDVTTRKLHDHADALVDLAWIEAGMPIHRQMVDLGQTTLQAAAEIEPLADEHGIALDVQTEDDLILMGDAERLKQAVARMIDNGVRYSGDGLRVEVRAWREGDSVLCAVTDAGIGIAPEEQDMIFDRLYRSRETRVQQIPGGGLGLALARRIAQRHGGAITVVSERDRGSTFTLKLPAADA